MSYDDDFEALEAAWFTAPAKALYNDYRLEAGGPAWDELHESAQFLWKESAIACLRAAESRGPRPLYNNPDLW